MSDRQVAEAYHIVSFRPFCRSYFGLYLSFQILLRKCQHVLNIPMLLVQNLSNRGNRVLDPEEADISE